MHTLRVSLLALCLTSFAHAAAPPGRAQPQPQPLPSGPLHQHIDRLISSTKDFAKFAAPQAGDAEFVRRLYLDLTGCIPSVEQARAFLNDSAPDKRAQLIDKLLTSPEHARHMATVFDVMLMERLPDRNVPHAVWSEYLRQSFLANKPWDEMAREILSGDGEDVSKRYRVKFFVERAGEPNVITRDISRLFLGTNLQCAQCHDHPRVEEYTQADYYGLFAFLNRTTLLTDRKKRVAMLSEKADGEVSYQSVFDPTKKTKTSLPRVPGRQAIKDAPVDKTKPYLVAPAAGVAAVPRYSRRAQLAAALTKSDYVPFRRNIANRLWAHMMGQGLVEPLDMDHPGNPPTHPELLDLLSRDIAERKFDMRGFLRELALSQTYQRSSELPDNVVAKDAPQYAAAILKPMTPEQIAWSLMQATGLTDTQRLSLGTKATEALIHTRLVANVGTFVRTFGSPAGMAQSFDARMDQALFLANGPTVRSWLVDRPGSLVNRVAKRTGDAVAEELYLSIFTRMPDNDERKEVAEFLKRRPGAYSDLAWALLASTEFRFNH